MKRTIFEQEHDLFREAFRTFVKREITPFHGKWEQDGIVPREVWRKAGEGGFLCMAVPEALGGPGADDFRFNAIVIEELAYAGATGPMFAVQNDLVLPYLMALATEEQKKRWFPKMVTGECITAIAMTEPGCGSDLASMKTTAERRGDHYVLNGSKTFISNGILADLVLVAARTSKEDKPAKGISLLVVERGMPGFERGKRLHKIGMHAQDTSELFFTDVKVPRANLVGEEGRGFLFMMQKLVSERASTAVMAMAGAEAALDWTVQYCKERKAFGQAIGEFQNSRFKLAEMKTEVEVGRAFVDRLIVEHSRGELKSEEAAMGKWWTTDLQSRIVDQCLQLHGGYGYMHEYPIARAFIDTRVQRIFAGTNEIMKEIIGRSMGL